MSTRKTPFAPGEWYHCYSRGIDKRRVFDDEQDYQRFIQTLHLCNNTEPLHRDNIRKRSHREILAIPTSQALVSIAAYCLMPNHFHLLIKENVPGGVQAFMQKLGTAYTMYYNIKNSRAGGLFVKPFRSKHVADDRYFGHVANYIHLNPAELFESGWKQGKIGNIKALEIALRVYQYSSFPDYQDILRPEKVLLDQASFDLLKLRTPLSSEVVTEAHEYYKSLPDLD